MPSDSNPNTYFEDREDASKQLIETLPIELFSKNETVVIGVSEGGVYLQIRYLRLSMHRWTYY